MQKLIDIILNFFKQLFTSRRTVTTPVQDDDDDDNGTIIVGTQPNQSNPPVEESNPAVVESTVPPIQNYKELDVGLTSQAFQSVYLDYHRYPAVEVWKTIGGGLNDAYGKDGSIDATANSCATRMSHALNYAGVPIPKGSIGANRNYDGTTSGDNLYYIIQARKLRTYLHESWGAPNQTLTHPKQIDMLKQTLKANQYAIIISDGHASAVSPEYNDNYIRHYLGDMWILPL